MSWTGIWNALFGAGTWGAGGNIVAWVLCGALAFGWLRAKMQAHHVALLAQAAKHHKELRDLAEVGQRAIVQQAERHHEALLGAVAATAPAPLEPLMSAEAPAVPVPGPGAERLARRKPRPAPKGEQ